MTKTMVISSSGEPPAPAAFDPSRLRAEFEDARALRRIVLEALAQLPGHIQQLRGALEDERLPTLATHARLLAQLLAGLQAFPASEWALRLQYAAEAASPGLRDALAGLERAIDQLLPELAEHFDFRL